MSDKIRVTLQPNRIEMEEGSEPQEFVLSVQNVADYVDQFSVQLDGLDPSWYTLPITSVSLFPQDRDEVHIRVHPRKEDGAKAGEYPIRVTVQSRAQPTESTTAEAELSIRAFAVFTAEMLPPTRLKCRRKASFSARIINRGNVDISLLPKAVDREDGCRFEYQPSPVRLKAGSPPPTLDMRFIAYPRRSFWVGATKTYEITLTLTPEGLRGEAKTLSAQAIHQPLLPSWRPVFRWARRLAGVVIVLLAALFGWQTVQSEGGLAALPDTTSRWVAQARGQLQDLFGLQRDQPTPGRTPAYGVASPTTIEAPSAPAAPDQGEGVAEIAAAQKADAQLVGDIASAQPLRDRDGNLFQSSSNGTLIYWQQTRTVFFLSKVNKAVYELREGKFSLISQK